MATRTAAHFLAEAKIPPPTLFSRIRSGCRGQVMMTNDTVCHECGAPLPADGDCWSRVNDLLEIEIRALAPLDLEVGKRAHFIAIATYQLQHPSRLTLPILERLRASIAEMLDPNARPIEELRRDMARVTNGSQRVRSRAPASDRLPVPHWPPQWTMTVMDVIATSDHAYPTEVARWAIATLSDLERAKAT